MPYHTLNIQNIIAKGLLLLLCSLSLPCCSDIPPEITEHARQWPLANRDYGNTRNTLDSEINAQTVGTLGIAWTFPLTGIGEWGAATTNPLIAGATVYVQDMQSNITALKLTDGSVQWQKTYNLDAYGPNGPALGWNKLFVQKGHYDIAALDLSGNELWSTKLSDRDSVGIDIQLVPYGGFVYASTVPGTSNADFYTGGGVGFIYALSQLTGKVAWSFSTVDSADIWGNPEVNSGGGAWQPPAIDTDTGIMYWGIGNPAPWPGTSEFPNGSSRPGDNLYTNSMIALDAKTGKLQWYKQVKPHDILDHDFQISPILTTAQINGDTREIVIGAGKLGKVYAFDRADGTILWETPVGDHQNDNLTSLPEGTTRVLPGVLGGVETAMALADDTLYVPVVNLFGDFTPSAFVASTFDISAGTGELVALDIATGDILWSTEFGAINIGAATVVNDLVFTSTFDGMIYALDRATGQEVWKYQAPGSINGWPAVSGDTIIFPVGLGQTPQLIAFRTGITVEPAEFKADGVITPGEYPNKQTYNDYEINWKNDEQYFYTAIKAPVTGFVALGIQPGTRMKGADILFGFVQNDAVQVYDMYSTGDFGPHPSDTELGGTDDILESGGTEKDGVTVIEFKRSLSTGDQYDNALTPGANTIIWSYGTTDNPDIKHMVRGYGEITIQ